MLTPPRDHGTAKEGATPDGETQTVRRSPPGRAGREKGPGTSFSRIEGPEYALYHVLISRQVFNALSRGTLVSGDLLHPRSVSAGQNSTLSS